MDSGRVERIKSSWQQVKPIADQAAQLFYQRLFELDPSLRRLFKDDIAEQGKKLMQAISLVVASLERLDKLVPIVWQLGRRHSVYGVQSSHYQTVAQALLWTLEQGLGAAFTPQLKEDWTEAYLVLAKVMQDGQNCEYANLPQ